MVTHGLVLPLIVGILALRIKIIIVILTARGKAREKR